jgi:transcriptional regulator with XRE-family HTH domain
MTESQARQLGKLIARARERKEWSFRQLAGEIGADPAWVVRLEQGKFASPGPERLARIAELLDIDPERMDRISHGHVSGSLPEVRTYFRAKFDLPDTAIGQIEDLLTELRDEYGGDGAPKR